MNPYRSSWTARDSEPQPSTTHGLGRRGVPFRVNPRELTRWQARQEYTRARYHRDSPHGRQRIAAVVARPSAT